MQWEEAKQQATIANADSGKTLTIGVSPNASQIPYADKPVGKSQASAIPFTPAEVNRKDDTGATVLMKAAANGNTNHVKELLAAGADANAKDNKGKTALLDAAVRAVSIASRR